MGLFISENKHRNIYKNGTELNEPNQAIYRRDHLTGLLEAQREEYNRLLQSINKLNVISEHRDNQQSRKWQDLTNQIAIIYDKSLKQEATDQAMIDRLNVLVEDNQVLHQTILNDKSLDQVHLRLFEQLNLTRKELLIHANEQKNVQEIMVKKLENQEALTEKVLRQMNNLRSVLFERTSFLAEKVDDGFKLSSAYLFQLLTRTDQSFMLYLPNKKKH